MSMPRRFSSHWSCLWDRIHAKFRDVFALGTGMAMHRIPIRTPLRFVCMLILLALVVSSVANAQSPCEQIKTACTNAGFVQGGASSGTGLWRGCVEPILQGRAHPKKATRPLPSVDPTVVAVCKEQNPNFGPGGQKGGAGTTTSVAPPSPLPMTQPKT